MKQIGILMDLKYDGSPFCPNGYEAATICAVDSCVACAFVCQHSNCSCRSNHANCLSIVNKILEKTFAFSGSNDRVLKWYQDTINRLLVEREGILKKKQRISLQGLHESQKQLLKALDSGEFTKITGGSVFNVVKILKTIPQADVLNFNEKINIKISSIEKSLKEFRELWDDQTTERKLIQENCWQVMEGQNEVDVLSYFNLSSVTYLGLRALNQETIKVLGTLCSSLSQIYLCDKKYNLSVDIGMFEIKSMGKYLKNKLKKFAIKSQNITMKQIEILSKQVPYLQELILEDTMSIPVKSQNEVQRLFPRCRITFI